MNIRFFWPVLRLINRHVRIKTHAAHLDYLVLVRFSREASREYLDVTTIQRDKRVALQHYCLSDCQLAERETFWLSLARDEDGNTHDFEPLPSPFDAVGYADSDEQVRISFDVTDLLRGVDVSAMFRFRRHYFEHHWKPSILDE